VRPRTPCRPTARIDAPSGIYRPLLRLVADGDGAGHADRCTVLGLAGVRRVLDDHRGVLDGRHVGGIAVFPQKTTHYGQFEPRHIPQHLPDSWLDHLPASGIGNLPLRRDAAIRLVQSALAQPRQQAGAYLGFKRAVVCWTGTKILPFLRVGDNAAEHARAVARLADVIAADPERIDYRRRRDHLRNWTIDEDVWKEIIADVDRYQQLHNGQPVTWNEVKRLGASVHVWGAVSSSEPRFGPVPALNHPARREILALARIIRRSDLTPPRHSFLIPLRALLDRHSQQLAAEVDRQACSDGTWQRFPSST